MGYISTMYFDLGLKQKKEWIKSTLFFYTYYLKPLVPGVGISVIFL